MSPYESSSSGSISTMNYDVKMNENGRKKLNNYSSLPLNLIIRHKFNQAHVLHLLVLLMGHSQNVCVFNIKWVNRDAEKSKCLYEMICTGGKAWKKKFTWQMRLTRLTKGFPSVSLLPCQAEISGSGLKAERKSCVRGEKGKKNNWRRMKNSCLLEPCVLHIV